MSLLQLQKILTVNNYLNEQDIPIGSLVKSNSPATIKLWGTFEDRRHIANSRADPAIEVYYVEHGEILMIVDAFIIENPKPISRVIDLWIGVLTRNKLFYTSLLEFLMLKTQNKFIRHG